MDVRVYEAWHQALPGQVNLGEVLPGEEMRGLAEVSNMQDPLSLRDDTLHVLSRVPAHQENIPILVKDQHPGNSRY